jgi:hypothetical protein
VSDWSQMLSTHFDVQVRHGDEWMVKCPFHDDGRASLRFNVAKGLFICFSCGARGNARTMQKHLGIRTGHSDGEIDMVALRARIDALHHPTADIVTVLDESQLNRYAFPTGYWGERGLEPSTVAVFDLGYEPVGGYVTIPVRNTNGGLLGVIRRFLDPGAPYRYLYPKGFRRNTNLFGSWLVENDDSDHVVLCEGAVDAMKVWQAGYSAVACYGNSIAPEQIRLLRRMGVGQVTVMGDNDRGGRALLACAKGVRVSTSGGVAHTRYDPATDLRRWFVVRRVSYPAGYPKDPGGMNDDQVDLVLRKARYVV